VANNGNTFSVTNTGTTPIWGSHQGTRQYQGRFDRREGDAWVPFMLRRDCDDFARAAPLMPGVSKETIDILPKARPAGRYRYRVHYQREPLALHLLENVSLQTLYRVETEFEVAPVSP